MLSWPEVIIIGTVALVFFGPKRLPEMARSIGQGIKEFRKATHEGLSALSDKESSETPKCPFCHQTLPIDKSQFCPHCGKTLTSLPSPP